MVVDHALQRGARLREVGSKPEGAAFKGVERIASTLTPIVSSSFVAFGIWKRTPIEPTSEVCCATMRSVPMAAM